MPRVFISHAFSDRRAVEREVISLLERHGIDVWYARTDIKTAEEWERAIVRGLQECDWFLIVLSPRSAMSEWVKDELHWAFANRPGKVVPVLLEDSPLDEFHIRLPRVQCVDFRNPSDENRHKLLQTWGLQLLTTDAETRWPPSPGRRQAKGSTEHTQSAVGNSTSAGGNPDNLLHIMWECLDPSLQDAFSLAYNKKRRQGGNRISTKDFFQALVRLQDDSVQSLIESLPEGALPGPFDPSVSAEKRLVLEESPLLSDCVADSLEHFRNLDHLPRKISPADLFVDIAKHGHGESVARLRAHGVGEKEIEEQVRRRGLSVLRRRKG